MDEVECGTPSEKTMKPAGRNVLIRPFSDEIMFAGKIHLPDTAKSRACEGIVIAVGCWCESVSPGDWVIFSRKQATDVIHDNVTHVIVDERAIPLILEEESKDIAYA